MHTRERRQLRLFVRRDTYGRYVSVPGLPAARPLHHRGPRAVRRRSSRTGSAASRVEFTARVSESTPARLHFVVRPPKGGERSATSTPPTSSAGSPRPRAPGATTSPPPCIAEYGEEDGAAAGPPLRRLVPRGLQGGLPAAHRRGRPRPARGASRATAASTCRSTSRWTPAAARRGSRSSGSGAPLSLSAGAADAVVDGRRGRRRAALRARRARRGRRYIYDFGLRYGRALPDDARELFQDAFARGLGRATTRSTASTRWCSRAGLTWRQATVLRAYAKYMRQGGTPFAPGLHRGRAARQRRHHPAAGRSSSRRASTPAATALGRRRRGPHGADRGDRGPDRARARRRRQPRPRPDPALLPDPSSRRRCAPTTSSSTPTGGTKPTSRSSSSPSAIPDLPEPRPRFEIFVYSPRVEGVHLRFGAVARGGLRWSDRRDDFRTEVLGLVKAQMVKNTVIVPVGAKGGFFCKQLPDPGRPRRVAGRGHRLLQDVHLRPARHHRQPRRRRDRAAATAWSATTATTPTSWSPPTRAPRRSPTSPTASPRTTASGSATRSPPAARSATTTRRWASPPAAPGCRCSGTSASCGVDCQTEDFTCVGIGDMSGDVFGNGMLLLRAHPAGRGVRPPRHLPRPDPDAGDVVRRAQAAVRPAAVELAGLRHSR